MKSTVILLALGLSISATTVVPGEALASPVIRDHRANKVVKIRSNRVVVRDHRGKPPQHAPGKRPVVRDHRKGGEDYGRSGHVRIRPARDRDDADRFAAEMFVRQADDLDCEDLGDLLRRISNEILSAHQTSAIPDAQERRLHPDQRRVYRLKRMLKRPEFVKIVWDRLTDAFEGCERTCFDDGVAMGLISGSGYCATSIGLGGMPEEGFQYQPPLPLCGSATFVGCQEGYLQAVDETLGCSEYAEGDYLETFEHTMSQDCHIDDEDEDLRR